MTTHDGRTLDITKKGKLYYLPTKHSDKLCVTKECTLKELHDTISHCNVSDLQTVVHGIQIKDPDEKLFCNFCCKGKMTHSAMSKKPDQRAMKPFDMVHSDLAEPIIPTARDVLFMLSYL